MIHRASLTFVLLVMMAALGGARAADPPDHRHSVAVVIGNKTYQGRIPDVAYAHRDADAMKAYLTQVPGYREGNIIDLRDATQAQITSAFGNRVSHEGELWGYVRPGKSHVTVFYSGHGVPGLKDGRGYLLPVNANPDTPEINGYPVDVLCENLAKLEAASVTVYLDACFSGESGGGMLIRSASPVFVQAALPQSAGGLTVLTAASAEQVASWDEENQHGLFTYHLLQALQGEADKEPFGNGDGRVTTAEAKTYLDEEMSYVARRRFRRKHTASVQGAGDTLLGVVPAEPAQVAALTQTFAVMEMDRTMVVAEVSVNTRTGPGTTYRRVETLSRGTPVEVTGKVEGKDWYRIALAGGRTAYIFAPLLGDAAPSPAQPAVGVFPAAPAPGETFKDCDECPQMVVIPAGSFQMGSPSFEAGRDEDEGPVHRVTIPQDIAVGKYEVTKGEFAAFVSATGYSVGSACWTFEGGTWEERSGRSWRDPGFRQSERDPMVCVSWDDARAYTDWLSRQTGRTYRLLSEAEWEYAARAGTTTARSWGEDSAAACTFANVYDSTSKSVNGFDLAIHVCDDGVAHTAAAGRYKPNAFGLHDMLGNVWEWTADCWSDSYAGAPLDGGAWTQGTCARRMLRGGSWDNGPGFVRSASRSGYGTGTRANGVGFRVALGPMTTKPLPSPATPAVGEFPDPQSKTGPSRSTPGRSFRDCEECPELVVVPAGSFQMGSPSDEEGRGEDEGPVRQVTIARDLAVGKYTITKSEFAAFVSATGYEAGSSCWILVGSEWKQVPGLSWRDPGFHQGDRGPAVCLNWEDAYAYIAWLSRLTGKRYRLLSEAEWEYAARAGTTTSRPWGDNSASACGYANVYDRTGKSVVGFNWNAHDCDDGAPRTAAVGSYEANAFGLYDMLGNVWEWTADCQNDSYAGAPSDGSAWTQGDCRKRILRGGSWINDPNLVRSASRVGNWLNRDFVSGFRVARTN